MSVPYTGDVILISQKCCPSASSLEPRMAAVPQLYSEWKLTLRLSQLSNVAVDRLLASQTQSNSGKITSHNFIRRQWTCQLPFIIWCIKKCSIYSQRMEDQRAQPNDKLAKVVSDSGDINKSTCTLVVLSTVAIFDLVKTSQARVVAALGLGVTAAVGLSGDGHCTGDRRDHHRCKVCLGV